MPSTTPAENLLTSISLVGWLCLFCIAVAVALLAHHLITRPPLTLHTKLRLALGLGVFPLLAAVTSTAEGMRGTTKRSFCGSCHVMGLHVRDASDPNSPSLAARHARNPFFGDRNCYVCHADYGMLGYPMTKLTGMQHVWAYYTGGFAKESTQEALQRVRLYKPYDNANCRQCHSGTLPQWSKVPEHVSLKAQLDDNSVSCASEGCHGFAHPFSKSASKASSLSELMDGELMQGVP